MKYPDFVIGGTLKSGTTSVFHYLSDHSEVTAANTKELQYFQDEGSCVFRESANYNLHGIEKYAMLFNQSQPENVFVEATPGYMYQNTALTAFAQELALKDTKIIFILREPVSKLISTFNYFSKTRLELDRNLNFEDYINLVKKKDFSLKWNEFLFDSIQHGQYVDYIEKWIKACGAHRISVYLYEDLKHDNRNFMVNLANDMGIESSFYEHYQFNRKNKTVNIKYHYLHKVVNQVKDFIPRSFIPQKIKKIYQDINRVEIAKTETVNEQLIDKLIMHYKPYNNRLENLLKIDLTKWQTY